MNVFGPDLWKSIQHESILEIEPEWMNSHSCVCVCVLVGLFLFLTKFCCVGFATEGTFLAQSGPTDGHIAEAGQEKV